MLTRKILLNIEATSNCSASCSMCPRTQIDSFGFMEPETCERLISQVDARRVWEICLAGRGEPTLHPRFPRLLEIVAASGIRTAVVTTGVNLNRKNLDACVRHADRIRLSVSSARRDLFAKIHVGLDYDRVWDRIETLAGEAAPKVFVHLTGGPDIYAGLPETVERLRELGIRNFQLLPLWNRGGGIDSRIENRARIAMATALGLTLSEEEHLQMPRWLFPFHLLGHKLTNRRHCPVGDSSMSVSYEGEFLGCFQDFGHTSVVGSVFTDSLDGIVRSRRAKLGRMPICKGCDAHKVALAGR
jgi:MoaA/NifB/PqqE/SkfB family radical SAM enzyme